MTWLTLLRDRTELATIELARASQATVLGLADWSQRHSPELTRRAISGSLRVVERQVDEPARLVGQPYRLLQSLVTLHGEFAQRLLELAEDEPRPAPSGGPDDDRTGDNIVDLARFARTARASAR